MYVVINVALLFVCCTPYIQGAILRNTTNGDVEIYYAKEWRPLLAMSILRIQEQKVLCRTMGFQHDTVILTSKSYQPKIGEPKAVAANIRCLGNETNVDNCEVFVIFNKTNSDETLIHLKCLGLSLKLTGGDNTSGLLLAQEESSYYPVCADDDFYQSFAQTACRVLGFNSTYGFNLRPERYVTTALSTGRDLLFNCTDKARDVGCELHSYDTVHECLFPVNPAVLFPWLSAVLCTDQDLDYRLTHVDESSDERRLEVKFDGEWGAVCGKFSAEAAEVACRSLNQPTTNARSNSGLFNGGIRATLIGVRLCNGTEQSLVDCPRSLYGKACIGFQAYQSLSCSEALEGDVRATNLDGDTATIFHDGQWLPFGLNSTSGGHNEAEVLCRSLNMSTYYVSIKNYEYLQDCWLKSIHCNGSENNILDCTGANLTGVISPESCHSFKLKCTQKLGIARINDSGLLEVQQYGRWGTVCSEKLNDFGNYEASVICKSLNKSSSLSSVSKGSNSPKRSGPIWFTHVKCNSTAESWGECGYKTRGNCTHGDDVHVYCDELNVTSIKYRLVEKVPGLDYVGYPEISINGQWGSICWSDGDKFKNQFIVAQVICRSLGFETGGAMFASGNHIAQRNISSKVWLDAYFMGCNGTEKSLMDCKHRYPGDHDCDMRDEWPPVYCGPNQSVPDYSLRVVDGPNKQAGRLEMMMFNKWGTVCNNNFTQIDTKAACRILHFSHELSSVLEVGTYREGSGIIWLSDLICDDLERPDFRYCSFSMLGQSKCNHSQDVGVSCQDKEPIKPPKKYLAIIIGSSVGGVALVAIIIGIAVYVKAKKRSDRELELLHPSVYKASEVQGFAN